MLQSEKLILASFFSLRARVFISLTLGASALIFQVFIIENPSSSLPRGPLFSTFLSQTVRRSVPQIRLEAINSNYRY